MNCQSCRKVLTPEMNTEDCPNSIYWHGKHDVFVLDCSGIPRTISEQIPSHKSGLKRFMYNLWKRLQGKQV